ncbi:MAG: hypothetical protein PVH29_05790 [Candidatus Zixiibacteriota bacterium]|jgi:hypothetical protein
MEYDTWSITPPELKDSGYSLLMFKSGLTGPYDVCLNEIGKVNNIGSVKHCYRGGIRLPEAEAGAFQSFELRLKSAETRNVGLNIATPFLGADLKNRLLESSEIRFNYGDAEEFAVDYIAMERFFQDNAPEYIPANVRDAADGDVTIITGVLRVRKFEMYVSTEAESGRGLSLDVDFINENVDAGAGFEAGAESVEGVTYKVSFSSEDRYLPLAAARRLLIYNDATERLLLGHEPYRP